MVGQVGIRDPPIIRDFKLLMGSKKSDSLQSNLKLMNLSYDENDFTLVKCLNNNKDSKLFSPEELSSYILQYLKSSAEEYLKSKPMNNLPLGSRLDDSNGKIDRVVIGIPVNFSTSSKNATRKAAYMAGFHEVYHIYIYIYICNHNIGDMFIISYFINSYIILGTFDGRIYCCCYGIWSISCR